MQTGLKEYFDTSRKIIVRGSENRKTCPAAAARRYCVAAAAAAAAAVCIDSHTIKHRSRGGKIMILVI